MIFIQPRKIFNPDSNDSANSRKIWRGNTTGLIQLNDIVYPEALNNYNLQLNQFWIPEKYDITGDVNEFSLLTKEELKCYKWFISYLTFLDSIQCTMLPNIGSQITNPEYRLAIGQQQSMEGIHVKSYQYMLETVFPEKSERDGVYMYFKKDEMLLDRIKQITTPYQAFIDDPTDENYFQALVADYALEGLYFYVAFIFFYNLTHRGLLSKHTDIFKLINRDERLHYDLFARLIKNSLGYFKEHDKALFEPMKMFIVDFFGIAVENEIKWCNHILGDDIIGLTATATEEYIKHLANKRLETLGLPKIYKGVKNPYIHLERISAIESDTATKGNFFESGVTSYNMGASLKGLDKI